MTDASASTELLLALNSASYYGRIEAALGGLAAACDRPTLPAVERFRWVREGLEAAAPRPPPARGLDGVTIDFARRLPLMFELLVTLAEGRVRGYGYRTTGRQSGALVASLQGLLAATLRLMLEGGMGQEAAQDLPALFQLGFPDLSRLSTYASMAPTMMLGVVPKADGLRFQVFFNTRLGDPRGGSRQLDAMLTRAGCATSGFGARLYESAYSEHARLFGVGFDFGPQGARRARVYFLIDRQYYDEMTAGVRALATASGHPREAERARADLERMRAAFPAEALEDDIELAVSIARDEPLGLKFSLTFTGPDPSAALETLAGAHGCSLGALAPALRSLGAGVPRGVLVHRTIHAMALQLVPGRPARLDLTLTPLL